MKKIFLIATGGTIASSDAGEGLTPTINAEELLSYIPEVRDICVLEGISVMSIDSCNMTPEGMARIAEAIYENYQNYDGFVISHGTDTMGYTSAFLSYALKNLGKPVVLTGAQLSMEAAYTDAKKNMCDAIRFACEGVAGVYVAFDGLIINGTHAKKVKSTNADAYASINYPAVAQIDLRGITYDDGLTYWNPEDVVLPEIKGDFEIQQKFCKDIIILKLYPGIGTEIFDFVKEHYQGVVIESYGLGGIPDVEGGDILSKIEELLEAGLAVAITTQCIYEGYEFNGYEIGRKIAKLNPIAGGDMITEALIMKLMWALGNYDSIEEVKKFVETAYFADRSYLAEKGE